MNIFSTQPQKIFFFLKTKTNPLIIPDAILTKGHNIETKNRFLIYMISSEINLILTNKYSKVNARYPQLITNYK